LRFPRETVTADPVASIDPVAAEPNRVPTLNELDAPELEALIGAATWYAKYHERMIAELADDSSALAETKRERFQDLHRGLSKLGVRLRRPGSLSLP
jgi:hypothetical protein